MTQGTRLSPILVMEDGPDRLGAILGLLREEGFDPAGASTPKEALDHLARGWFSGIVILFRFPHSSSDEFFQRVKALVPKPWVLMKAGTYVRDEIEPALDGVEVEYLERVDDSLDILRCVNRATRRQLDRQSRELEGALAERTAAFQELQQRFNQVAEHLREVFWLTSADQRHLVYVSPAYEAVWGRSCRSLYENPASYLEWIDPDDRQALLDRDREEWTQGIRRHEFRLVRPDGAIRWIHARVFPIRNAQGDVSCLATLCEDVTERKRAEEALLKTERQYRHSSKMEAIGTLAGGIAHDFNNILTAILGYTELALATVPKESRTTRNLQEVLTAGHRAKHLVQQILTFSRQSGPERQPTQIVRVVREALKLLRATIPVTIDIRPSIHSESTVMADPTQLHQVIVNLCTNAEYAMRETGGELDVILEDLEVSESSASEHPELKAGPYVRLTVRDNGQGMPSEVLDRMFDPFYTTKPVGEGSGMGLAVVHGIVTGHGGAISVESVPGRGTKVEVYLPTISLKTWEEMTELAPLPNGRESILFVDDEEALVRLGQELLTHLGYRVEVRTSSVEALELFRADPHRFDLVITDQTMPTLTGEFLARELLRIRPELPIILCTGFSHIMSAEKAKALGIRGYLMKPLAIRDLAPIVRHVLDEQGDPVSS